MAAQAFRPVHTAHLNRHPPAAPVGGCLNNTAVSLSVFLCVKKGLHALAEQQKQAAQQAAQQASQSAGSTAGGKTEVSRQAYDDCDGSGHGYYEITYSDGSTAIEEY